MKLILIATFLVSLNAKATSYCYDRGVFALYDVKDALLKCDGKEGMNVSIRPIDSLENRLTASLPFFYKTRALKGVSTLEKYLNNLEKTECHDQLITDFQAKYKQTILKAIDFCSP